MPGVLVLKQSGVECKGYRKTPASHTYQVRRPALKSSQSNTGIQGIPDCRITSEDGQ